MKKIKNISLLVLFSTAMVFMMTSCQKTFNAKSYAPTKPVPPPPPPPTFNGFNSSAEIEPTSLLDYFPFTSSNADSLGNLTGTNVGSVGTMAGVSGNAFQGAVSSYVLFSDPGKLPTMTSYTVSLWMNSPKTNGFARGIFSLNNPTDFWGSLDVYLDNPGSTDPKGDTLIFKVHMTNASGVPFAGVFLQSKVPNAVNTWTHMVVTYDAATSMITFYQNGVPINISGVAGTSGFVKSPLVIPGDDPVKNNGVLYGPIKFPNPTAAVLGTWQFQTTPSLTASATAQTWAESYTGGLDNFRIYNKALTSDEVVALYNLEKLGR